MNYAVHYQRLMQRAATPRVLAYRERHHVLPRCMGGNDFPDNLVLLTPEEHYVAHQLLVKMHPDVKGLALAAFRMAQQCKGRRAYGWLRRKMAADMRGNQRGKGKRQPLSVAHRAKLSQAKLGKKRGPHSMIHAARISAAKLGHLVSATTRHKISVALLQRNRQEVA